MFGVQSEKQVKSMNQLTLDFDAKKPAEDRDACRQTSLDAYMTTDRKNDRNRFGSFRELWLTISNSVRDTAMGGPDGKA